MAASSSPGLGTTDEADEHDQDHRTSDSSWSHHPYADDAILSEAARLRSDLHRFKGNVDAAHQDSEQQLKDIEKLEERVQDYMRNLSNVRPTDGGGVSFATANATFDASNFNLLDDTDASNLARVGGPFVAVNGKIVSTDTNVSIMEMELDNERHRSQNLEERASRFEENLRSAVAANTSLSAELTNTRRLYDDQLSSFKQQERLWKDKLSELRRTFTLNHSLLLRLWQSVQNLRRSHNELSHGTSRELTRFHAALGQAAATVDGACRRSDLLKVMHSFERSPELRHCLRRIMLEHGLNAHSNTDQLLVAIQRSLETYAEQDANLDLSRSRRDLSQMEQQLSEERQQWEEKLADLNERYAEGQTKLADLEMAVSRVAQMVVEHGGRRSLSPAGALRSRSVSPATGNENVRTVRHALIQYKHDLDAAEKQREQMRVELERLSKNLAAAEQNLETAYQKAADIEAHRSRLDKDLKVWPEKASEMVAEERRRNESKLGNLEQQLTDVRAQLGDKHNALEGAKYDLSRLGTEHDQLQRNNDKIEKELAEESRRRQAVELKWSRAVDDLSARDAELKDFRARCEEFARRLDELLEENRRLQMERDDYARQLEDSGQSRNELDKQVESLQLQLSKLREKYDASTTSIHELTEVRRQLEHTLASRSNELNLLQDESSEQSQNAARALKQLDEARTTIGDLERQLAAERNNVQETKAFSEELRTEWTRKLEESQNQAQKLWDSFTKAQNDRQLIEEECTRIKDENSRIQTQFDELQETLLEARANATSVTEERNRLFEKVTEIVTQFRRSTESFGMPEFDSVDGGFESISQLLDSLRIQLDAAVRDKNEALRERHSLHSDLVEARRSHASVQQSADATERRLHTTEEANARLELKLSNLHKSMEMQLDEIRSGKEQVKALKAKLKTLEVQAGAKDARIKQLMETESRVRAELDALRREAVAAAESEETLAAEKARALLDVRALTDQRDQALRQLDQARTECKTLQTAKSEYISRLKTAEDDLADVRLELDRTKRNLEAKSTEGAELRARLSHKGDAEAALSQLRADNDRLNGELREQKALSSKLRSELDAQRGVLFETENQLDEQKTKAIALEADLASARAKLDEKTGTAHSFEQTIATLRSQLSEVNAREHASQRDLAEARKQVERLAAELKGAQQQSDDLRATVQRLQRERRTMHAKIEALEKQHGQLRAELAKTAEDRAAIDRGFAKLEQENRDKQRHIHELTAQIAQLEHEHAARLLDLSKTAGGAKQYNAAVNAELVNLRRQLNNEKSAYERRVSQLRAEVNELRAKLHAEQNRRVDYLKKLNASDRGIHEQHRHLSQSLKSFDRDLVLNSRLSQTPYARAAELDNLDDGFDLPDAARSTGAKHKIVKRTEWKTTHAARSLQPQLENISPDPIASSTPTKGGVSFSTAETEPRVTPSRREI